MLPQYLDRNLPYTASIVHRECLKIEFLLARMLAGRSHAFSVLSEQDAGLKTICELRKSTKYSYALHRVWKLHPLSRDRTLSARTTMMTIGFGLLLKMKLCDFLAALSSLQQGCFDPQGRFSFDGHWTALCVWASLVPTKNCWLSMRLTVVDSRKK